MAKKDQAKSTAQDMMTGWTGGPGLVVENATSGTKLRPKYLDPGETGSDDFPKTDLISTPRTDYIPRPGMVDGGQIDHQQRLTTGLYTVENSFEPKTENWSRERIVVLQNSLAAIGLLSSFKEGQWDTKSAKAFQTVLKYSNQTNQPYDQAIAELARLPAGTLSDVLGAQDAAAADALAEQQRVQDLQNSRLDFTAETYLAPDVDNVRNSVKTMIENTVGRGYVRDSWVESMTQNFMDNYRAQFEQQQRINEAEFETEETNRLLRAGLKPGQANPDKEQFGPLDDETGIDPAADLETEVMEKIRPIAESIEEEERSDEAERSAFGVFSSFGSLSQ